MTQAQALIPKGQEALFPPLKRVRLLLQRYLLTLQPWRVEDEELSSDVDQFIVETLKGLTSNDAVRQTVDLITKLLETEGLTLPEQPPDQPEAMALARVQQQFDMIRHSFRLTELHVDALWVLLAPELSNEMLWLYRALMRSSRMRFWPAEFVMQVLSPKSRSESLLEVKRLFDPEGTLVSTGLVTYDFEHDRVRASQGMLEYILGRETMPPDLLSQIRLVDVGAVESLWEPNPKQVKLLRSGMRRGGKFIFTDCGDEEAVEHATELLRALVSELIVVGLDLLVEIGVSRMLPQIDFFARVHGAGVVITRVAATMEKPDGIHRTRYLLTRLAALGVPTVLALGRPTQPEVAFTAFECFDGTEIVCAIPSAPERKAMWERALRGIPNGPRLAERVAPLPMRRVALRAAIRLAERYARLRGQTRRRITQVDIEQAWQTIVGQTLSRLGERVKTRGNWDDLVLDDEASQVIEEIRAFATHRTRIMTEWGFDNKIPYGRGLTMLFGGPSGTGKTFAAGLLSQEMGVVLYKIDISRVMSKWVGETEKHLAKLFDEAQAHKVAMLFDEADALFGARTEVRTSSDRYANLETNFLLQKMEEFDGMVILTTNHKKLIDPAFSRRIRYHVNFNEPDAELREILWRKLIPSEMPVADDVDFEALAYFYEVNGGNIRNIVLRAAVFAAQEGTGLTHAILDKAAAIEYRALGRLVPTDDLDI